MNHAVCIALQYQGIPAGLLHMWTWDTDILSMQWLSFWFFCNFTTLRPVDYTWFSPRENGCVLKNRESSSYCGCYTNIGTQYCFCNFMVDYIWLLARERRAVCWNRESSGYCGCAGATQMLVHSTVYYTSPSMEQVDNWLTQSYKIECPQYRTQWKKFVTLLKILAHCIQQLVYVYTVRRCVMRLSLRFLVTWKCLLSMVIG